MKRLVAAAAAVLALAGCASDGGPIPDYTPPPTFAETCAATYHGKVLSSSNSYSTVNSKGDIATIYVTVNLCIDEDGRTKAVNLE